MHSGSYSAGFLRTAKLSAPLVVQAVHEMNRQTGANVDPNKDPAELMEGGTRGLMNAVHQLPALVERKRTIEKHSTLLHKLLKVHQRLPPLCTLRSCCVSCRPRSALNKLRMGICQVQAAN